MAHSGFLPSKTKKIKSEVAHKVRNWCLPQHNGGFIIAAVTILFSLCKSAAHRATTLALLYYAQVQVA